MNRPVLLSVENLTIGFGRDLSPVRVVRNLGFRLDRGETLGIVGESGSGKTITALTIMGLQTAAARVGGSIRFEGEELLPHREARMTALRGNAMAMIFQEPMTALNPVHRIGDQIAEGLILHEGMGESDALKEAARLLERVGIAQAAERLSAYPHEMSGGQRQRVMIAMALACRPELLIADEPTSALDVTVQAQLLDLIRDVVAERQMALIVISHDLGVVTELAARTIVLYGGAVMEEGETSRLFRAPQHPYTQGLVAAIPGRGGRRKRLSAIPGNVPPPHLLAPGCPFFGRCPIGDEICRDEPPPSHEGVSVVMCHKVGGAP